MTKTRGFKNLTPKQEAFAQACLDRDHPAADAYRAAYDAENMLPGAVYVETSKILRHPKVSRRIINELRDHLTPAITEKRVGTLYA